MLFMSDLFALPVTGWVEVAVDAGIDAGGRGLHYAIDDELAGVAIGDAVMVPLGRGNRRVRGWVVDRLDAAPHNAPATLKHVFELVADAPSIPLDLVRLGMWIADYYMAPLGPTLAAMLPPRGTAATGMRPSRWMQLAQSSDTAGRLGKQQQRILAWLTQRGSNAGPVERSAIITALDLPDATAIDRLHSRGLLDEVSAPRLSPDSDSAPKLTRDQHCVVDAVSADLNGGFTAHLLHGVTGAGKTEVYLHLAKAALDHGHAVLVLVPEILLTPQLAARLKQRFPNRRIEVLHSGVSPGRRRAAWKAIRSGDVDIVLGARSAVFAPIAHHRLGLIIVDEEHDASFRQDNTPRYHGRDVAVRRAQMADCCVLLGSATPSMESWWNATVTGRYALHRLPERAPGLSRPKVRLVDRMEERARDKGPMTSLGPTLRAALARTLVEGRQTLLLLNRRGWATYIACQNKGCGWVMRCDHCDASLVFHRKRALDAGGVLHCHHCMSQLRMPEGCPSCNGRLARLGEGSQRLEDEIAHLHPDLQAGRQLVRLDVDSRGGEAQVQQVMDDLHAGTIRVLVGTQMIAKGLDLPGVGLVGVVDADTALHIPDFRAAERTFQLVAQVAGRCGRGGEGGTVIIQTCASDDPAITLAAREDFNTFAANELAHRKAAGLPPAARLARCILEHVDLQTVRTHAQQLEQRLRAVGGHWLVNPAAPCPLARIAGRHRWHVEVLGADAGALHQGLATARTQACFEGLGSVTIDVDPTQVS